MITLPLERNSKHRAFKIWCHFLFANLSPNCSFNILALDSSQFYDCPLNRMNKLFSVNVHSESPAIYSLWTIYPSSDLIFASISILVSSLLVWVCPYSILSSLNLSSIYFCNSYFCTKSCITLHRCFRLHV